MPLPQVLAYQRALLMPSIFDTAPSGSGLAKSELTALMSVPPGYPFRTGRGERSGAAADAEI